MKKSNIAIWQQVSVMKMRQIGLVNQLLDKFGTRITALDVTDVERIPFDQETLSGPPRFRIILYLYDSAGILNRVKIWWVYGSSKGWEVSLLTPENTYTYPGAKLDKEIIRIVEDLLEEKE